MDVKMFLQFMRLMSPYFQQDKDFQDFLENGFRYNELRNLETFQEKSTLSKITRENPSRSNEIHTVRTILQPHNIMLILEETLSKKGNLAYINFFKVLKGNDFDRDNHLYFKEWEKSLKEQRIDLRDD